MQGSMKPILAQTTHWRHQAKQASLVFQLKDDLAGQEVDDDGHDEEDAVQTHTPEEQNNTYVTWQQQQRACYKHTSWLLCFRDPCSDEDRPIKGMHTVKQQLALFRRRHQKERDTESLRDTKTSESYPLRLHQPQKFRLQQQLQQVQRNWDSRTSLFQVRYQCDVLLNHIFDCPSLSLSPCLNQHVQLLIQIHLLTSPVSRLHSEAETTRQFLVINLFIHLRPLHTFNTPVASSYLANNGY